MIRATGWSWEYVDQHMTLPRLDAFLEDWRQTPAIESLAAWYMGYKPSGKGNANAEPTPSDIAEMAELVESLPTMRLPKILTPEEYLAQKAAMG